MILQNDKAYNCLKAHLIPLFHSCSCWADETHYLTNLRSLFSLIWTLAFFLFKFTYLTCSLWYFRGIIGAFTLEEVPNRYVLRLGVGREILPYLQEFIL